MINHQTLGEWSQWFWPFFANHLWQATLFGVVVWIAAILLKQARARHNVSHIIWIMSFAKFLFPSICLFLIAKGLGLNISWPSGSNVIDTNNADVLLQIAEPIIQFEQPGVDAAHSDLYCVLTALWALGAVLCFAHWRIRRHRLSAATLDGKRIGTGREALMLENLKSRLGVSRRVDLIISSRFAEPFVWRALRPVIVLPQGLAEQLTDRELESVMTHELFHAKHFDNLFGSLQMFICCLFWFHPLVWLIDRKLIEARELRCDDLVLLNGAAPEDYAASLWKVVQFGFGWRVEGVSRATGSNLNRRIKLMLNADYRSKSSIVNRSLAGITFATLIALAVTMALFSRDKTALAGSAIAGAPIVQDKKYIATAPMQFENMPDLPIIITDARFSIGDARARTENAAGPDGVKVVVTYKEGAAREVEYLINMVNQGNRRITGIIVDIQNEPFWGKKHALSPHILSSNPAAVSEKAIDSQGTFTFRDNMLIEEKEGDGNLMSHLYDFKVRVMAVRFDSEQNWIWSASAKTARQSETAISFPSKRRDTIILKDESASKISLTEQNQQANDQIRPMDISTRPTILYREKASYTQEARDNQIQGIVVLSVVFGTDSQLQDIEVVQGLPYGLNESAIAAAKKLRFEPAVKDGQPVSVRGKLEFSFNLYNYSGPIYQMDASLRPKITYREKAQYTQEARDNNVEGTVALNVVFGVDGHVSVLSVIKELPYGLTQEAVEATKKIRFEPAMVDGKSVNVRGTLEFTFKL